MSALLRTCVVAGLVAWMGCAPGLDTTRSVAQRGSLGQELHAVLCDRVGAQSLREDVTGASYQQACHPGEQDSAVAPVDRTLLPPLSPGATDAEGQVVSLDAQRSGRERGIARVEVLAEERDPLAAAFDAMLPDLALGTTGCGGADTALPLHDALRDALSQLVPLYDDGTVPHVTRAVGRLLREVQTEPELNRALARLDARKGYRPDALALYVLGPVLSYPRLFELGGALAAVHREDKHGARTALGRLLHQAGDELVRSASRPAVEEPRLVLRSDAMTGRTFASRPRSLRELSLGVLGALAAPGDDHPSSIVQRDARGLSRVLPRHGTLPWPFMPDAVGEPAIDALGRFITQDGRPAPQPFSARPERDVPRDALGRALAADGSALYAYLDVSGSVLSNVVSRLGPLFRPRKDGGPEAMFDALSLEGPLFGARVKHADGGSRFVADEAPVLDLVHALTSALLRPEVDDVLALFEKLSREQPELIARMVRLALALDAIAERYPQVSLRPGSTLWDELFDVFIQMGRQGRLLEDLLLAFSDERTLKLGHVFASYMRYRDDITYFRDPRAPDSRDSLNGKAWNATVGDFSDMHTPVDRSEPDSGGNRSVLQRFLQLLHDANGLSACSKDGAVAHVDITWPPGGGGVPIRLDYPTSPLAGAVCAFLGSEAPDHIPECGILRFDNVAEMLIAVALGEANIAVRDDCLSKLVSSPLSGLVGGANSFLQETSGIDGFSLSPTVPGVARLAFFDAPYTQWGGYVGDVYYPKTSQFLEDVIDPVPSMVCPAESYTDPVDGRILSMRRCERFEDTLRGRDPNGLFLLEQLDFLEVVQPLARAFGANQANASFVGLLDVLHRHWGTAWQTQEECDPALPVTEARYCTQDGVVAYEPMIAAMLEETDLFAELGVLVSALRATTIRHCDAVDSGGRCTAVSERDGIRVLTAAVRGLLDPARNMGLTDRRGDGRSLRNDGTYNPQTTPLALAVDALARVDAAWVAQPDQHATWLGARGALVDSLLGVRGDEEHPRFGLRGFEVALPMLLDLLRQQVAAHCPGLASGGSCDWAERELVADLARWIEEPLTAFVFETLDAVLADADARTELGRFLSHLLAQAQGDASQAAIQAALLDLLQVLGDDANLRPLSALLGHALATTSKAHGVALAPALLELLSRFFDTPGQTGCTAIDPHHAFAVSLSRAVTPMGEGQRAPVEVLLDAAYRVNRQNPRETGDLTPQDFASLGTELADALVDEQSGLEQVYAILRQATAQP